MERRKFLSGLGTATVRVVAASVAGTGTAASATAPPSSATRSVCVFDVNGSLLDVDSMAPFFQKVFGDDGIKMTRIWYDDLALYSNVIASSGRYPGTFIELGQAVLQMEASAYHAELRPADIDQLKTQMLSMRMFPDVPDGLRMLKDAGFRLATLTNSPPGPQGSEFQLSQAGIADCFERHFNAAMVRTFKVAPSAYHMVAELMDVPVSACCMITAHYWDALGAQFVGYSSGLMHRPGLASLPMHGLPQPLAVAQDLPGLAAQLIKIRHEQSKVERRSLY
jgi:2-haloacid dehalogenase